ncbi:FAD-dependent monooxygenase, partial [Dermatophilus congolensis]|uniref:FAD-dependent monooxygenase n=5 Tax=Dermatophilus congolensis TaxID=1863 RepID=UPI001AB03BD6
MQFHHHGYVSGDPHTQPAAATGINRPTDLPKTMDVLIVGTGPAGMMLAASLSAYPEVMTRIIDRRPGRLEIGQADGIQARSVETFQAFGFAHRITEEAYRITEMNFWAPDPHNPAHIIRTSRADDDPHGISEFPHLIVNQARVLDYLAEYAANSPARLHPDYGYEFVSLEKTPNDPDHPIHVTLRHTSGPHKDTTTTVRTKYLIGCDGTRSKVRAAIGRKLTGDSALHAWGVMDVLAVTDFPDIRTKCAIQSSAGSILHIPREGGHLFRSYVDLGTTAPDDAGRIRNTLIETIIDKANQILSPYTLEVKNVAWWSVYEVGHRLTDKFDDTPHNSTHTPRIFIAGDACHTHSAKAGQGMNVSMQDTFNLGWKLGQVLTGLSPESLLHTYSNERHVIAQNLIDFDKKWSSLMAKPAHEWEDQGELARFYTSTAEFPAGFMTQYQPSTITNQHQHLATGYPIGKRFTSAHVIRVCDTNPLHLGHQHRADGRWRIYA